MELRNTLSNKDIGKVLGVREDQVSECVRCLRDRGFNVPTKKKIRDKGTMVKAVEDFINQQK